MQEKVDKYIYYVSENRYRVKFLKVDKTRNIRISFDQYINGSLDEARNLRDKNLSYKAKGLLSFMLSLPEDWDYSLKGLCSISKENRDAIRSTLKELQQNHYLEIEKVRGDKGYFEYNYLIYEKPNHIDIDNKKSSPDMEIPQINTNIINTNIINTNKQIDKDDKTISSFLLLKNIID